MPHAWPAPYLQPNPREDCGYYASAYLCRCLGHPEVTAEQVKAWREETHILEALYAQRVCGHPAERYSQYIHTDENEQRRFWLGLGTRPWVEAHLARGEIALVHLHRVAEMTHAVVLLASQGDAGVLLMDPIYGHIVEPWGWFLGIGPGHHGCHWIECWYTSGA